MEFTVKDVQKDLEAKKKLLEIGAHSVPVVVKGKQFAHGLDMKKVSDLVGVDTSRDDQLMPRQLFQKIEIIQEAAVRYIEQLPKDSLSEKIGTRTGRDFIYHIFKISDIFLSTYDGEIYSYDLHYATPPHWMQEKVHLIDYGNEIIIQMQDWWEKNQHISFNQTRDTYYGETTLHELLERTTWHTTQHVRQLMDILDKKGIQPNIPLTEEDLNGLPIPKAIWD